jgi:hypothetical protein
MGQRSGWRPVLAKTGLYRAIALSSSATLDSQSDSRAHGRRWTSVDESGIHDGHLRTRWTCMDCPGRLLRDC